MKIILPGIPPSKKNGRIIIHGKGGRHFDIPSNEYQKWEKEMVWEIRQQCPGRSRMENGVHLEICYHVSDNRSWDLSNKAEGIQDLLKKCGVISDDNRFIVQDLHAHWKTGESNFTEIVLTDASPASQQLLPLEKPPR